MQIVKVINNFFKSIKDSRIKDLEETVDRLQKELKYRDRFENALMKTIEDLETQK